MILRLFMRIDEEGETLHIRLTWLGSLLFRNRVDQLERAVREALTDR